MQESKAPIALFIYNRPQHLQRTLDFLAMNAEISESLLYVFADGAKSNAAEKDISKITEAREVAKQFAFSKKLILIERNENLGLGNSVIQGLNHVLSIHKSVIVLEDDLELSPYFLGFMNDALDCYKDENKVISIGACNFFAKEKNVPDSFFAPVPDCLGWATWRNQWVNFESDGKKLLQKLQEKELLDEFDLHGNYPFTQMLREQIEGRNSSWAIRWQATAYLNNQLCLYPKFALSNHLGNDASATHSVGVSYDELIEFPQKPIQVEFQNVETIPFIIQMMESAYRNQAGIAPEPTFYQKSRSVLGKIYRKLRPLPITLKPQNPWKGNYASFEEAKKNSEGYDSNIILEKVRNSLLKVKNGEAVYERDSVIFDKIEKAEELQKCMLEVMQKNGGKLSVLDFGGSLGSTYFQNRDELKKHGEIQWYICEQSNFVEAGKKDFESDELHFCESAEEVFTKAKPDILLISSVLQYLENPRLFLNQMMEYQIPHLLIDRTSFIDDEKRITVQTVPEEIYKASYPCWFFNEIELLELCELKYKLLCEFPSFCDPEQRAEDDTRMYWKGFFFEKE